MAYNDDKRIENIVKKTMNSTDLEKPSMAFTHNVMGKINVVENSKLKDKPLISRQVWAALALISIGLFTGLFVFDMESETTYFKGLKPLFSFDMDFSFLNIFSHLEYSNVFIYAVLLFGLMFGIQVSFLKHYFTRRLKM